MKQSILEYRSGATGPAGLCSGKLLFRFALFGWAMWWLARLAGESPAAQALVWGVALLVGAGLALATWEGDRGTP
ncbi:MAG TPA: hypothetical protein VEW74_00640 [Candidatus Nitrosotalea sp.]|nr:hypothetical protein [Candidatus Nitrosotalea sp.]